MIFLQVFNFSDIDGCVLSDDVIEQKQQ
jgi:hypothetical protein